MKYVISILTIFLFAIPLLAQQPSISYLMADEAKSQLQIHGSFGIDSGSVSIEDTTLGIVSWSDSLIICSLPDSGKGAGGHVEVETRNGVSNVGILSIVKVNVSRKIFYFSSGDFHDLWNYTWKLNWRAALENPPSSQIMIYPFEVSKSSKAFNYTDQINWRDSSILTKDSSFSIFGIMDLQHSSFLIHGDIQVQPSESPSEATILKPRFINFDSSGVIFTRDDVDGTIGFTYKWEDHTTGTILFPPNPKSIVSHRSESENDLINIYSENTELKLQCQTSLGSTTASLYTIDGRLLKRTKLDISAPGNYSMDVGDVHTRFAILVLQTSRGVITKKIIF